MLIIVTVSEINILMNNYDHNYYLTVREQHHFHLVPFHNQPELGFPRHLLNEPAESKKEKVAEVSGPPAEADVDEDSAAEAYRELQPTSK